MLDARKIRKDFPILKREVNGHPLIYFDNAATSQKPVSVINAISDFYKNHNANVHRAVHTLSQEASELYERAHDETAQFIGADGIEEIVFVRGTTEAINLVAYSFACHKLKKDDEVLVSVMEHHSNIVPWELLSRTCKFKIRYVDVKSDGTLDYESYENMIGKKTKIVCMSHVSNVTGVINDVKRITKIAHEKGALALIDGAQSVPHMPVNVKDLDVDLMAFSGHKMLGPTGIGALYGKRELLDNMEPFQGGGEMIKQVDFDPKTRRCRITWNTLPWKFEAGTPDVSGGVGLMEAIRYLSKLGMKNVQDHEKSLTRYALKHMETMGSGFNIYGPKDPAGKSGIIPFGFDGLSSHDIALMLDNYGIMIRSGYHCAQPLHESFKIGSSARASFYIYNTKEEIDQFIDVLKEIERLG